MTTWTPTRRSETSSKNVFGDRSGALVEGPLEGNGTHAVSNRRFPPIRRKPARKRYGPLKSVAVDPEFDACVARGQIHSFRGDDERVGSMRKLDPTVATNQSNLNVRRVTCWVPSHEIRQSRPGRTGRSRVYRQRPHSEGVG